MRRRLTVVWAVLVLVTLALTFAAGALFPWSPVRPGYAQQRFAGATVVYPSQASLPAAYLRIEEVMHEVARVQRLPFRQPVRVVLADSWGLFNRGALLGWGGSPLPVLGAALQTGTVIYLSPLAREPGWDQEAVLRHELTHALLFQQMRFVDTFDLAKLDWFEEGLAVHFGNADQYFDDLTWGRLAREHGYLFRVTGDPALGRIPESHRAKFMLAEYRIFIEYLMHRYGEDRFFRYRDRVLEAPARHEAAFAAVLGESLLDAVEAFEEAVRAGAWPGAGRAPRHAHGAAARGLP